MNTFKVIIAHAGDEHLFKSMAPGVFDHPVRADMLTRFLNDKSHHIAVAQQEQVIVGFCSANEYLHPDKPVQVWINELGVSEQHRRKGIGRALLTAMLTHLGTLGFDKVWLATEHDNTPAIELYRTMNAAETDGIVMFEMNPNSPATL